MSTIKRRNNITDLCARRNTCWTRRAFTLLEILLVLALMAVVLGGLAATIKLFSNNYTANERRVGRAQLARSISQMLSDDLEAAIQDPIQNVAEDPDRQFVRHFGLRGDERSLQIDVVQPNLFTTTATAEENKKIASGADKTSASKQAPELKTVFYEFVPINSPEILEGETSEDSTTKTNENASGQLGGSLTSVDGDTALWLDGSDDLLNTFLDVTRPLVQKFGLSRRELDYETPDEKESDDSNVVETTSTGSLIDPETGQASSTLAGSLTSTPDASNSTLASGVNSLSPVGSNVTDKPVFKEPLTAAQIAMDVDDGTTWAPEVLDCRFSYFDGNEWLTSWDSIEKNGLPVAIKVELKLAPLDDVDLYRASPLLFELPVPPDLDSIAKLSSEEESELDDGINVSRLAGSLTKTADETKKGAPIDVFNSYRPLSSIRAALSGVSLPSEVSTLMETTPSDSTNDDGTEKNAGEVAEIQSGGGLSGNTTDAQSALDGNSGLTQGDTSVSSMAALAQTLASRGVVYNEAGVCVDFANLGNYTTLERMAVEIGVSEPIVYEVVAYLPTTPYSRAKTLERRKPAVVRAGKVATRQARNASSRERRASGANPYATGRARQIQERRVNERTASNRAPRERQRNERGAASRQNRDRDVASRDVGGAPRSTVERGTRNRTNRTRAATTRQTRERLGANGGQVESPVDEGLVEALNAEGGVPGVEASAPNVGFNSFDAPSPDAGALGGATGIPTGSATPLNGLDPFEVVNSSLDDVPFAGGGSEFDAVDSATGGLTMGLIESPTGDMNVVTSQTSTPKTSKKQQQTWIRGKK